MTALNRRRVVVLAAAFVAFGVLANVALATHSWGGYHWARTANPFTLKLGDNLTTTSWKGFLAQTSSDWSPVGTTTPLSTTIVTGQSNKRCAAVTGTTQVCNGKYGNNGWLGLATISITGGVHITKGTAKMNDTYFVTAPYNNDTEKQHVMCQEVAHTFGLDHQSVDGSSQDSCMDYSNSLTSTGPNPHDFIELGIIYGHTDTFTTVSAVTSASAAAGEGNDDHNAWGKLVSQSNNGRSSTYEAYEKDGSKTVTHVLWTKEAASKCPSCDHRYDNGH